MYNNPTFIREKINRLKSQLESLSPSENQSEFGTIHHQLAQLYTELASFEKPKDAMVNLQHAESAFLEALRFWKPESHVADYIGVHVNLIGVCLELAQANVNSNSEAVLLRGIQYAELVLQYETQMTHHQKILTYRNLGQLYTAFADMHEDVVICEKAVSAFEKNLALAPVDLNPQDYENACYHLSHTLKRIANMKRDQTSWQRIIDFIQKVSEPFQQVWQRNLHWEIQLIMALAKLKMLDFVTNKKEAYEVARYCEATVMETLKNIPADDQYWNLRKILNSALGYNYILCASYTPHDSYYADAIIYLKKALDKRLIEVNLYDYAEINYRIGFAYLSLNRFTDGKPYLKEAEKYFRELKEFEKIRTINKFLMPKVHRKQAEPEPEGLMGIIERIKRWLSRFL